MPSLPEQLLLVLFGSPADANVLESVLHTVEPRETDGHLLETSSKMDYADLGMKP